ncbi:MAG TPA: SigE family RNA polymerase sigma factor [Streptosporangiaceae bacterium]|nr:SigE family RNA polymerase sigma factor [Streptosporangiaceae bacterium]
MDADAGDPFEEFVRGRSARLFRLAMLLAGQNRAEAGELLEIALERAYRRRATASRDRSPEPYVRQVLVSTSIDRWRSLRRRAGQPPAAGEPGPEVRDATGEIADRDLLLRSLAALPPRQRAVLVLRYWEDLPEAEIASVLRCTVGTVRSQASRGLARLREAAASRVAERPETAAPDQPGTAVTAQAERPETGDRDD